MSKFTESIKKNTQTKSKGAQGSDYIKLTSDHQTIIRVLDAEPVESWRHFISQGHKAFPKANGGFGIAIMCLGWNNCPVCGYNKQEKAGGGKNLLNASRVFTFNVLDRTPVKVCPNEDCQFETYETQGTWVLSCPSCGTNLSTVEEAPRNKIKIMQKGITIATQLASFEKDDDFGDLKDYDIKFDVKGKGKDVQVICIPKPSSKSVEDLIGKDWESKLFDIQKIVEPWSEDVVNRVLAGERYLDIVASNA